MKRAATTKFFQFVFPFMLVCIAVFLCFKNYTPGTYLIGWDSLHPEFNFTEAFRRIIFGVWRGEQGVGAVAIHSHMADLPRIIFLYLESFFLPISFLRYSYIFLCLILGPLGVYFFLIYCFRRDRDDASVYVGSFLGALYYLLNLATLQQFYVPFEMFATQFAFIPWLFLFALKILREGKKSNLIIFSLLTLFSSPQAYAGTLFYAYLGALSLFIFGYFVLLRSKQIFKKGVGILAIVILLNLYWILPNIYSIVFESGVVISSKINTLFSPEASLRNKSFSELNNILISKNFLFDWRAFNYESNQYSDLMAGWSKHLVSGYVLVSFYLLALISLLGAIFSFIKKDRIAVCVFGVSVYSIFFLSGGNFGSKVFEEALRMPFTKFSIIFVFAFSFFFGYFFFVLISIFKNRILRSFFGLLAILSVSFILINSTLPMFNGDLISPIVRRNFPNEYHQLFDWFSDHQGRVVALPLNTMWGWDYHSWKYEGSGFLTYGLSNPLLARDFDRWSLYNETFYNQSSFALYANDNQGFIDTLKKYQVRYLLLDESIINAGSSSKLLYLDQIKSIIQSSPDVKKVAQFGFLTVFDLGSNVSEVTQINKYAKNNINLDYSQIDPVYSKFGDYVQVGEEQLRFNISSESLAVKSDLILGGFKSGYNCDLMKLGSVSKKVESDGVKYKSDNNGIECDFFELPTLLHSQGYLLRIKGENISGRGIKIYLQNWTTNKIDLEELLPVGKFDKSFLILPKHEVTGKEIGYTLNLETRSFGKISSENKITSIEFYPVNTDYLNNLTQGPSFLATNSNDLRVKSVQKYGTWLYKVDVQNWGLIQLGQGYDTGWKAFPIRNFQSIINVPVFNSELKHVKVNSWSNGWLVDAQNCQNENSVNTANCQLIIVFWPQLLEWGGGLLGLMTLGVLVFRRRI